MLLDTHYHIFKSSFINKLVFFASIKLKQNILMLNALNDLDVCKNPKMGDVPVGSRPSGWWLP